MPVNLKLANDDRPINILFVHGWGAEPRFWRPMLDRLLSESEYQPEVADLGFYGGEWGCSSKPDWVVAHSMGALWAIRNWEELGEPAFISLCGFTKFVADKSFRSGVSPRLLSRMERRVQSEPFNQIRDFCQQAAGEHMAKPDGCEANDLNTYCPIDVEPDKDRLAWGLCALKDWDLREQWEAMAARTDVFIVADKRDPIVSASLTEACFPNQKIHWTDFGNHWIPWTNPDLCASLIQKRIETKIRPN